jgi:hypothetical protein
MRAGLVSVAYLHPGSWSSCFGKSMIDLLVHDLCGPGRIMSHPYGEMGKEAGAGGLVAGRNHLARIFLDESEAEWLFMVDSDMGFAADTVDRLVESADADDRPIMGGLAFAQKSAGRGDHYAQRYRCTPTIYTLAETDDDAGFLPMMDYPRDEVVRCDATGAACLLIHRWSLEEIRDRYGDTWFDPIRKPKSPITASYGEDMSFCLRALACDLTVHVNTAVKTTHDKGGVFFDEETYDLQQAMLRSRDGV